MPRDLPLGFPVRCVECFDVGQFRPEARALDLGCAVGRATFELGRYCSSALGIDYSRSFIAAAGKLKDHGSLVYDRVDEGKRTTRCTAVVPGEIDRSVVDFQWGDATRLPESLAGFDLVLAANLICRLREPQLLLARLPRLVRPGGQLVITTPCTWLEEFTPEEDWIGGRELPTLDGLQAALAASFELVGTRDLAFLIREHQRKYQLGIAQASVWRRR